MSSQKPLISIIPVYNGEVFLEDAVRTLKRQHQAPLEIIVVDDGSTDATAEIAAGLNGDIKYLYQANQGPAAARNTGIHAATGDPIIGFLASMTSCAGKLSAFAFVVQSSLSLVIGRTQLMKRTTTLDETGF
jgi:cellulose synthase/poly-beta-1,6-N-acetylglucosamine synthase-like glycosyltransferase